MATEEIDASDVPADTVRRSFARVRWPEQRAVARALLQRRALPLSDAFGAMLALALSGPGHGRSRRSDRPGRCTADRGRQRGWRSTMTAIASS